MRLMGMLLLNIPGLCCEASVSIRSSVEVLVYPSFSFSHLLILMTPLLQKDCWQELCASTRFVPVLFDWMLHIGAYASLLGFMLYSLLSPSFPGIPKTRKTAHACLQPGPEKNLENAVALNASSVAFFSFFVSSAHPYVVGPK